MCHNFTAKLGFNVGIGKAPQLKISTICDLLYFIENYTAAMFCSDSNIYHKRWYIYVHHTTQPL
jgi:hypothetical protein